MYTIRLWPGAAATMIRRIRPRFNFDIASSDPPWARASRAVVRGHCYRCSTYKLFCPPSRRYVLLPNICWCHYPTLEIALRKLAKLATDLFFYCVWTPKHMVFVLQQEVDFGPRAIHLKRLRFENQKQKPEGRRLARDVLPAINDFGLSTVVSGYAINIDTLRNPVFETPRPSSKPHLSQRRPGVRNCFLPRIPRTLAAPRVTKAIQLWLFKLACAGGSQCRRHLVYTRYHEDVMREWGHGVSPAEDFVDEGKWLRLGVGGMGWDIAGWNTSKQANMANMATPHTKNAGELAVAVATDARVGSGEDAALDGEVVDVLPTQKRQSGDSPRARSQRPISLAGRPEVLPKRDSRSSEFAAELKLNVRVGRLLRKVKTGMTQRGQGWRWYGAGTGTVGEAGRRALVGGGIDVVGTESSDGWRRWRKSSPMSLPYYSLAPPAPVPPMNYCSLLSLGNAGGRILHLAYVDFVVTSRVRYSQVPARTTPASVQVRIADIRDGSGQGVVGSGSAPPQPPGTSVGARMFTFRPTPHAEPTSTLTIAPFGERRAESSCSPLARRTTTDSMDVDASAQASGLTSSAPPSTSTSTSTPPAPTLGLPPPPYSHHSLASSVSASTESRSRLLPTLHPSIAASVSINGGSTQRRVMWSDLRCSVYRFLVSHKTAKSSFRGSTDNRRDTGSPMGRSTSSTFNKRRMCRYIVGGQNVEAVWGADEMGRYECWLLEGTVTVMRAITAVGTELSALRSRGLSKRVDCENNKWVKQKTYHHESATKRRTNATRLRPPKLHLPISVILREFKDLALSSRSSIEPACNSWPSELDLILSSGYENDGEGTIYSAAFVKQTDIAYFTDSPRDAPSIQRLLAATAMKLGYTKNPARLQSMYEPCTRSGAYNVFWMGRFHIENTEAYLHDVLEQFELARVPFICECGTKHRKFHRFLGSTHWNHALANGLQSLGVGAPKIWLPPSSSSLSPEMRDAYEIICKS
ncbi:hypothetical protein R3P38DRAFT_2775512 [Favolaschia claudopus]|uniref:Uncharacterized protein n=1 Tax=Favolaschia claudopus TaxID=2862362 RepID=A0AAW0BU51_9AGAR